MEVASPRDDGGGGGGGGSGSGANLSPGSFTSEILRARSLEYYNSCHHSGGRLHKSGSTTQLNGYHNGGGSALKFSSTPDGSRVSAIRDRNRSRSYVPPLNNVIRNERPHRTHSERATRNHIPRHHIGAYASASPHHSISSKAGLYRSNSSLDLDHNEDLTARQVDILRRDYGSTSSLDVYGSSGDSFFELVRDLRTSNIDQRSPGPPNIQEYLRGKIDPLPSTQNASNALANGSDSLEDAQSPRLKTKFHKLWEIKDRSSKTRSKLLGSEPSLFKKLRGGNNHRTDTPSLDQPSKVVEHVLDPEARLDEKVRRKVFAHYDCQSMTANLSYASRLRSLLSRRRNTTTGASAASMVGRMEDLGPEDVDYGDDRESSLVANCPFFRNELGGEEERMISLNRITSCKQQSAGPNSRCPPTLHKPSLACGLSLLENANASKWKHRSCPYQKIAWNIENVDVGALCYRQHFYNQEHQNWLGVDDQLGPVALSIKREKMAQAPGSFQYRIILRTSELSVLRGTIPEESLPGGSGLGSSHLPVRALMEVVAPELPLACLRLATPAAQEHLLRLDQQGLNKAYKVGIMYCKAHQNSEEEMYNNETSGPAFEEFLDLLGQRVRLKGFEKYRGGLDTKTDTTGLYSVYTTHHDCEIMFHVSTLLPYSPNNKQQLLRKRHIGNDIVTIVFQEPDSMAFTPKTIRSHFQHVFVVVRVHDPCSDKTRYSVAISRSKEVPVFGPPIPEGATFPKSRVFTEFLLTKVINGENAAHRSEKFATMAQRTRQEYLKDLAANYCTTTTVDSGPTKFSLLSFGGGKKKDRSITRPKFIPHSSVLGAITWQVQVEDYGQSIRVDAILGISVDTVVIVEESSREAIFACPTSSVLGWTSSQHNCLKLFYHQGECVLLRIRGDSDVDEIREIVARLECVSPGCESRELQLRRNSVGQLGFHLGSEGVVTEVEPCGFAWQAGLRPGARLLEICTVAVATLPYDAMVDLLKTSLTVTVTVVPPLTNNTPRRGCALHHCNYLPPTSPGDYENLTDLLLHPRPPPPTAKKESTVPSNAPSPNIHGAPKMSSLPNHPSYHSSLEALGGNQGGSHTDLAIITRQQMVASRSIISEGYHSDGDWHNRPSPLTGSNDELSSTEDAVQSEPCEITRLMPTPPSYANSPTSRLNRLRPGVTSTRTIHGGTPRLALAQSNAAASSGGSSCSGSTSTLQEDLLKLISPDFLEEHSEEGTKESPSSLPSSLERKGGASNLMDGTADIIVTKAQPAEVICASPVPSDLSSNGVSRLSPRVTTNTSPSQCGRLLPLPEGRDMDWTSLVDTATRAMQGLSTSPHHHSASSSSSSEKGSGSERGETASVDLEAHVRQLRSELLLEQSQKASLEEQIRHLQNENRRLHEESQMAAAEIQRLSHVIYSYSKEKNHHHHHT